MNHDGFATSLLDRVISVYATRSYGQAPPTEAHYATGIVRSVEIGKGEISMVLETLKIDPMHGGYETAIARGPGDLVAVSTIDSSSIRFRFSLTDHPPGLG